MRIRETKPEVKAESLIMAQLPKSAIVHDVHILDSSGSMAGGKYNNAIEGINADIMASQKQAEIFPEIKSTMTVVEFSGTKSMKYHMQMIPIEKAQLLTGKLMNGNTALYETIGATIEYLLLQKQPEDKVLMKIMTDGFENASRGKYSIRHDLANLIAKVQKEDNFTITFVGTKKDVANMINSLNIDESNTLVHENTAASIERSYKKTVNARTSFMYSMSKGEDVLTGFYSKKVN